MELEGKLSSSSTVADVLQWISMGKPTGRLVIMYEDRTVQLMVRQGKLVNSATTHRLMKLGQILIARGAVERSQVDDAVEYQQHQPSSLMLGQILTQKGIVTAEHLRMAIRLQIEEELWRLFGIIDGTFRFDHGDDASVGEVLLELEVEPMIIEGSRRLDEWTRIIRNIPDEEAVVDIVPLQDPSDRELMNFSDSEWRVLSLVNSYYSVRSIANRSGIGSFETLRILNSFLASGQVTLSEPRVSTDTGGAADPGVKGGTQSERNSALRLLGKLAASTVAATPRDGNGSSGRTVFSSPVSFVAAVANAVLDQLLATEEFIAGVDTTALGELYWRPVVNDLPKADLVKVQGNVVNTTSFDDCVEVAGVEGPLHSCYLDALEALSRYLRLLYLAAAQRLGAKAAQKILDQQFDAFRNRSEIGNNEEFYLQDYAARISA